MSINTNALAPARNRLPRSQTIAVAAAPDLPDIVKKPVWLGYAVIAIFIVGFFAWATLAPLAAGAVAPGIISPDGSRRVVQHLEGGIIQKIEVREGDRVKAGDPLVILQSTQAAASNELLLEQERSLTAMRARLQAEMVGNGAILFPSELLMEGDAKLRDMVQGQISIFRNRRATLAAQKQILDDRTAQYQEQINALEAQVGSVERQLALVEDEIGGKQVLFEKALITKPEILRLQRAQAALLGERGQYLGSIAEIKQRISELLTQRVSLDATRAEETSTELERVRGELASVTERLNATQDILARTVVTAPVSGKVTNLRFKSVGGVILRGEPILEIVPTEERLLIDARISPGDIDVVTLGLRATVHLTAFSSRGLPRVEGVVRVISADRLVDEATGQSYYLARVEVDREELAALDQELILLPGMPAEVLIITGERTALDYLIEPFQAAFRRGLREA